MEFLGTWRDSCNQVFQKDEDKHGYRQEENKISKKRIWFLLRYFRHITEDAGDWPVAIKNISNFNLVLGKIQQTLVKARGKEPVSNCTEYIEQKREGKVKQKKQLIIRIYCQGR